MIRAVLVATVIGCALIILAGANYTPAERARVHELNCLVWKTWHPWNYAEHCVDAKERPDPH
jgi:hypothetical protein